jgi:hypothetical protein
MKTQIIYNTEDYMATRSYNENEELSDIIFTYDYSKNLEYQYNLSTKLITNTAEDYDRPDKLCNDALSFFLTNKDKNNKCRFRYLGYDYVDDVKCYKIRLKFKNGNTFIFYIDMHLFYVMKADYFFPNIENQGEIINHHTIYEYDLDLNLENKYLFEENFK